MLVPVLVRANYKIAASQLIVVENLLGSNLPLLFPSITVMHRTAAVNSVTVSGDIRTLFTNQTDSDFDGAVIYSPFVAFSVGNGQSANTPALSQCMYPATYGITTELTITNAGPEPEAEVSVLVHGMIESAVSPDPGVTINV